MQPQPPHQQPPEEQPQHSSPSQEGRPTAAAVSQQLQVAREVAASLLSEAGAAAAAEAAGSSRELISTVRGYHRLLLQLAPSPEQLLVIRERVAPQLLLRLAPDDVRVQVLHADHTVSMLLCSGGWAEGRERVGAGSYCWCPTDTLLHSSWATCCASLGKPVQLFVQHRQCCGCMFLGQQPAALSVLHMHVADLTASHVTGFVCVCSLPVLLPHGRVC